jgi:hypothetical protein
MFDRKFQTYCTDHYSDRPHRSKRRGMFALKDENSTQKKPNSKKNI